MPSLCADAGVNITTVPSELNIQLQENETVLLQFHVHGAIAGTPRSTVRFSGEGQQLFCTGLRNYVPHYESKPLVKDLSVTCDQAYWLNTDQHRQKYEVRITNGDAAGNIDRVTVKLEVHYFEGEIFRGRTIEFGVDMMKNIATPTPDITTAMPTLEMTTSAATPTPEMTTATATTKITTTTPTSKMITTAASSTSETVSTSATPTQYSSTTPNLQQNVPQFGEPTGPRVIVATTSTSLVGDATSAPPTTLTTPSTQAAFTTMTLPTVSTLDNFISAITASTQNQITLVVGLVAVLLITIQFIVIACLAKSRRRYQVKLAAEYSESEPV